jgi:poly(ADP-ribose) glycohydrolase ARH3
MVDRARYRGVLLGAVVGDCLGAPFEGTPGPLPVDAWTAHDLDDAPLASTDDSAMTIAVAESLVRRGRLDEDDLGATFARRWALQPRAGYSRRTGELLARIHAGTPWREAQPDIGRASNGAAMRVAPIALFAAHNPDAALELAQRNAVVTHRHPRAIAAARAQTAAVLAALTLPADTAFSAAAFAHGVRRATADPVIEERVATAVELASRVDPDEIIQTIGSGLHAHESVPAASCAFMSHPDSFTRAVALAVRLGSDTDTVAAMTGAISGALLGEDAIPARWLARIPHTDHLRELADALHSAAHRAGPATV